MMKPAYKNSLSLFTEEIINASNIQMKSYNQKYTPHTFTTVRITHEFKTFRQQIHQAIRKPYFYTHQDETLCVHMSYETNEPSTSNPGVILYVVPSFIAVSLEINNIQWVSQ